VNPVISDKALIMKIILGLSVFLAAILAPAYADELEGLFDKGAQRHLFIDDWDGTMLFHNH
jgi:hypothetical protein